MGKLLGVDSVLGMKRWQTVAKLIVALAMLVAVSWGGMGDAAEAAFGRRSRAADTTQTTIKKVGNIAEASPPIVLQELRQALDNYQPQVSILSPRKNDVLSDNTVSVRFLVKDLPLFKNETFGLGPHLHVLLDNRPYQAVYDASQPLVFDNLEPGTHTIRAFASRPWHESFKNEGAFAQTTFHVFTKTQDNSPNRDLPLLTYSRPQGTYGAEPILLDFYLTNAPLHLVAQTDTTDDIADWRIRCTVNGDSFVIDRWQPLYLKGFKPGKNWVQLEYLDEKGNPVQNVFNNTVRMVNYQPNGDDTLSKLVRSELAAADVRGIVDPNYMPPVPIVKPTPEPSAEPAPAPSPKATPSLKLDRPSSIAPPLPEPNPSSSSSPEPTPDVVPLPTPSSPQSSPTPLAPAQPPAAIVPAVPSPEPRSQAKAEPASPQQQTAPGDVFSTTSFSGTERLSGAERLRRVGQKLGQYLPQKDLQQKAIAPSKVVPSSEPTPLPSVSIPDPLPPTLPEIIDTDPLEVPSAIAPAP